MKLQNVLIIEDCYSLAQTYKSFLKLPQFNLQSAETGNEGLKLVQKGGIDCIVLDVNLPDMSGMDVMKQLQEIPNCPEIVVITANGSIKLAVDVMRQGAFDFINKPLNAERLRTAVTNALARRAKSPNKNTGIERVDNERVGRFVGNCEAIQNVYQILRRAAPTNATVFVTGESGTGKELCAQAIHDLSNRAQRAFVPINCAAIPKDLLESEIFGHAKGAFTGATSDRKGAALQADGGTLFLDEICEMDMALQAKLLRFLQTRQVQRLGEDHLRSCDVRVVCASNQNPFEAVNQGRFRADLFYRLHVIPVELPPLRQRKGDIVLLAQAFLTQFSKEDNKSFMRVDDDAKKLLEEYEWPGNIRQLQNVIRNCVVLNDRETLSGAMLSPELMSHTGQAFDDCQNVELMPRALPALSQGKRLCDHGSLDDIIREAIEEAIDECNGSIPRAAAMLGLSPSTIYRRMESWNKEKVV